MDVVRNVFQMIGVIGAGYFATKVPNSTCRNHKCLDWSDIIARIIMCTFGNIVCITAASCLAYLPSSAKYGRLVALWFTNFQSIGFVLGLVMISSNIGGYTKKQFTSGVVFVAYCAGNIAGPQCECSLIGAGSRVSDI
jgi:hypothetical protein